MKNQYDRFLNQLQACSDSEGFRVVQPEILFIGDPDHYLVVARPFAPGETAQWLAKYGNLVRPSYAEEKKFPIGNNQKTDSLNKNIIRI